MADHMRFMKMDPADPSGFSEYGELLTGTDMLLTMSDDVGSAKINLLSADEDPLPPGSVVRLMHYGEAPSVQDHQPQNYTNWYLFEGRTRYFGNRGEVRCYRHTYTLRELMYSLADYPVRSTKTFRDGSYGSYAQVLAILGEIAFRPNLAGGIEPEFEVVTHPALQESNTFLSYTNASLYDAVSDIARRLDIVPALEVEYAAGRYHYYLMFFDKGGEQYEAADYAFFDWAEVSERSASRDSVAGTVISNAVNLAFDEGADYPKQGGLMPASTNLDRDWGIFRTPFPLREVQEIRVYWEKEMNKQAEGIAAHYFTGETFYLPPEESQHFDPDQFVLDHPLIVRYGENTEVTFVPDYTLGDGELGSITLLEAAEFQYLSPDDQERTLYYTQGGDEINLRAFLDKYVYWYRTDSAPGKAARAHYFSFDHWEADLPENGNRFLVGITCSPYIEGTVKGNGREDTPVTLFFNQYGQTVDYDSFGDTLDHYAHDMTKGDMIRGKILRKNSGDTWQSLWSQIPPVGSPVLDGESGRYYVITSESIVKKAGSLEVIVQLNENDIGKGRYVRADSTQKIAAIPRENQVTSSSLTNVRTLLSLSPITTDKRPFTGILTSVWKNALLGTQGFHPVQFAVMRFIFGSGAYKDYLQAVFQKNRTFGVSWHWKATSNTVIAVDVTQDPPVPRLYTDSDGKCERIRIWYKSDMNLNGSILADYPEGTGGADGEVQVTDLYTEHKDAYEITNHTTALSFVGLGNLQIGAGMAALCGFCAPAAEPLELVLLSRKLRRGESIREEQIIGSYPCAAASSASQITVTPSGTLAEDYKAWALIRGDHIILFDNVDKIGDNIVVYTKDILD